MAFDEERVKDPYGEKYIKEWEDSVKGVPAPDTVAPEIVTRDQWGALPPKETKPLKKPILECLFTHTQTEECQTREECIQFLQQKQKEDMEGENEYPDIQYNFYIGSDKTIYEGRGWNVDANKDDINQEMEGKSVDIAYIGNYEDKELSLELIQVGCELAKYGRKMELLHTHYNITTYWEDHVEILRPKYKYNPLDDDTPLIPEDYQKQYKKLMDSC